MSIYKLSALPSYLTVDSASKSIDRSTGRFEYQRVQRGQESINPHIYPTIYLLPRIYISVARPFSFSSCQKKVFRALILENHCRARCGLLLQL